MNASPVCNDPAVLGRLLDRLEVAECNCPAVWYDTPFSDGTSIRWLRPCRHVLAAWEAGSSQRQAPQDPDVWLALLRQRDSLAYQSRPPPAHSETTKGALARRRVMMLRWKHGEDLFHDDDETDLPRVLTFKSLASGSRQKLAADAPGSRPEKRTVCELRGPRLALMVPPGVVHAAQASATISQQSRLVVLSCTGRIYSVCEAEATASQSAAAVLRVSPERMGLEGGRPWTHR